jgi:hypothetical protein
MKLLIETQDLNDYEVITEGEGDAKGLFIKGPFIQTEVVNRNGRKYMKEHVSGEIAKYTIDKINSGRALGELNHPAHPEVNPERAAIKIVSLTETGNDYIGKAKVLEKVPMGAIVGGLIREGVKLGVSSRGLGTLRQMDGFKIVEKDFRLMTAADVVSDPSAPDAFVTAVMENREWVWENGNLIEREVEIKSIINNQCKSGGLTEEKLVGLFQKILTLV